MSQGPNYNDEDQGIRKTLRDEFAMAALTALGVAKELVLTASLTAGAAYKIADAMMEERTK